MYRQQSVRKRAVTPSNNKHSNGWSSKKEQLLQVWMDECNIYSKLYSYNVVWYERLDNILGIVGTLLSAITGASLLNNSDTSKPGAKTIIIVFGSLSMVNTFIQATKEYLNLKTVINTNLIASRQNKMICIDIEAQLNLSRIERINGKDFLTSIRDRKNDLILNGPVISNRIWKKILPKYGALKSSFKDDITIKKNDIAATDSHVYSNNSSDDIVYKRRPTMEVINLSNDFNKTSELNTIVEIENDDLNKSCSFNDLNLNFNNNDTLNGLDNNGNLINEHDLGNKKILQKQLYNVNNYINTNNSSNMNTNYNGNMNTNNNVHVDFIAKLEQQNDNEIEYTDEDDAEETAFLEKINKTNTACNQINIKLEKKPLNELEQELTRFHI